LKLKPDKNQITWGITISVTALIVMLMYYVIFKGGHIVSGIGAVINGMQGVMYGIVIAYVMSPVQNFIEQKWLEKIWEACGAKRDESGEFKHKKLIRNLAILLTMSFLLIIIVGFCSYIIPQLFYSISEIMHNVPTYYRNATRSIDELLQSADDDVRDNVNIIIKELYDRINGFIQTTLIPNMTQIVTVISKQALNFVSFFVNLFVGFIVAIYLLHSKENMCGKGKKMAYAFFKEKEANEIISSCRFVHATFTGFIMGKIIDSLIIGILSYIGNLILDIPYPLLIAVIVGITNIIPFFGPYIGGIMGFIILILIEPISALVFLIFVVILQQFDGNILGPKILGNSTGLSSFWVIFAIMLFGSLWGVAGWILGVPVFAVIYAFVNRVTEFYLEKKNLPTSEEKYIDTAYIEDMKFHYLGDPSSQKYRAQKTSSSWRRIFKIKHKKQNKTSPSEDKNDK